jgi:predicted site-specific integrase-resolvase
VHLAEHDQQDLRADLVAQVSAFPARLCGQRRAKRTTERITAALRGEEVEADAAC